MDEELKETICDHLADVLDTGYLVHTKKGWKSREEFVADFRRYLENLS